MFALSGLAASAHAQQQLDRATAQRLLDDQQRFMEARDIGRLMNLMAEAMTLELPDGQYLRKPQVEQVLTATFMNCNYVMFRPELLEFTPASESTPARIRYSTLEKCLFQIEEMRRVGVMRREYLFSLENGPAGPRFLKGQFQQLSQEVIGAY